MDQSPLDDSPKEECGVIAVWNHPEAVHLGYLGLFALQHRGQEAAGLAASSNEKINSQRGQGLVSDVLTPDRLKLLDNYYNKDKSSHPQNRGVIGHTRYSTAGGSGIENIQPLVETMFDGPIAIAHNGNLINADTWKHELSKRGQIFHTTSDTEVMIHLLASPDQRNTPDPTAAMLRNLQGAFSLTLLFKDRIEAARDPWGFRPLVLGKLDDDSPVIASETVALDVMGATFIREIEPGEIVTLSDEGVSSRRFAAPATKLARCIFEHVYFANPASNVFGQNVLISRERFGSQLAIESPVDADIVMPMPDSGRSAANGFAHKSGIPYREGIVPNRYVGRTFIKPTQAERAAAVRLKLNVVAEIVKDKRIIIVDDSIVRGTTTREKMKQIRQAGASEIHIRISCPPITNPCYFGVDFATPDQLIAHNKSVEEIREFLGVDSLRFLSHEGMLSVMNNAESGYCTACFTGNYPVDPDRPLACEVSAKAQPPLFTDG
ncbi:MAG: amidophosphoribosyltransferase [Phycisphaerales bacterium]|nr:amidophosphoribosyltransferase [Phycisphaerales bacterium]